MKKEDPAEPRAGRRNFMGLLGAAAGVAVAAETVAREARSRR